MKKWMDTRRIATIALVCVYLVVIAGSVVRVTGSGMGCPDWPKCFGYVIPPINQETLTLGSEKHFLKGQMIILNDTLWVAQQEVVTKDNKDLDRTIWKKYPKHDYAIFNPVHTWIEYINRLLTGVLGLPVLLLLVISIVNARKTSNWKVVFWAGLTLVFMLYEAWLGKLVVDGELSNGKVTLHMLGSIGIVAALMMARVSSHNEIIPKESIDRKWWFIGIVLVIAQVILGTQLREEVDQVIKNGWERQQWIDQILMSSGKIIFYVHRTFSWLLVIYLFWLANLLLKVKQNAVAVSLMGVVVAEVLVGVLLNYFGFPAFAQPLHLVLSFALLGLLLDGLFSKNSRVRQ